MKKKVLSMVVLVGALALPTTAWAYTAEALTTLREAPTVSMPLEESYNNQQGQLVGVYVNGQQKALSNPVFTCQGRTMMPLREVGNLLGVTIMWEPDGQKGLILVKDVSGKEILMNPQKNIAIVEGKAVPIDKDNAKVSSDRLNGVTYLPVAFLSQCVDRQIVWENDYHAVNISTTNQSPQKITAPIPAKAEPAPAPTGQVAALDSYSESHAYASDTVAGHGVKYVTINLNDKSIKPVLLCAQNTLLQTQRLGDMAKNANAFAAINGTYFQAYGGTPVPWGMLIKDGRLLHDGSTGSVVGITKDNKVVMDQLVNIDYKGYINGEHKAIMWRINHPSTEADAITLFTPDYTVPVTLEAGAKAAVVRGGVVTELAQGSFTVPADGFVISYNSAVAHLVDERYKVGDKVSYDYAFQTHYTQPSDWKDVVVAVGAGPSLILNGTVTADGAVEGFWEAKINTGRAGRTFIGATAEGKVLLGTISSATLQEAAAVCQGLNLVNAMCLDGGGSIALQYQGVYKAGPGRDVNNGLGFIRVE